MGWGGKGQAGALQGSRVHGAQGSHACIRTCARGMSRRKGRICSSRSDRSSLVVMAVTLCCRGMGRRHAGLGRHLSPQHINTQAWWTWNRMQLGHKGPKRGATAAAAHAPQFQCTSIRSSGGRVDAHKAVRSKEVQLLTARRSHCATNAPQRWRGGCGRCRSAASPPRSPPSGSQSPAHIVGAGWGTITHRGSQSRGFWRHSPQPAAAPPPLHTPLLLPLFTACTHAHLVAPLAPAPGRDDDLGLLQQAHILVIL